MLRPPMSARAACAAASDGRPVQVQEQGRRIRGTSGWDETVHGRRATSLAGGGDVVDRYGCERYIYGGRIGLLLQ